MTFFLQSCQNLQSVYCKQRTKKNILLEKMRNFYVERERNFKLFEVFYRKQFPKTKSTKHKRISVLWTYSCLQVFPKAVISIKFQSRELLFSHFHDKVRWWPNKAAITCTFVLEITVRDLTSESHLWSRSVESLATSGTTGCAPMCTTNKIQQKPLHTLETMRTPIQIKHTRKKRHLYTSLLCNN